jgi:hypothetical protein
MKVNGESLKDLSNSESMETLRKAMQKEGAIPGHIHADRTIPSNEGMQKANYCPTKCHIK